MEIIRVLLVDNEEVFREGLAKLLSDQPHIEVVYQCSGVKEAIEKGTPRNPDVILVSQSSDYDTTDFVKEVISRSPAMRVAVISRPGEGPDPIHVIRSGARAFLAKNISAHDLVKSIELISSGRIIISPVFAEKFIKEIAPPDDAGQAVADEKKSGLSRRELEIVRLIAEGNTNKEIAQKLFVAENTVKVHVKNALSKLELRNRQQLVAYAVLNNWLTDNSGKDGT